MRKRFSGRAKLSPALVLREESDDYAILYNPDTTEAYAINPIGVQVCRMLDGAHTVSDLAASIREEFSDVPENVEGDIREFIGALIACNLASEQ